MDTPKEQAAKLAQSQAQNLVIFAPSPVVCYIPDCTTRRMSHADALASTAVFQAGPFAVALCCEHLVKLHAEIEKYLATVKVA